MSRNSVEQFDHSGLKIRIEHDSDAESPRDWDNLGRMVCWHNRYSLGDVSERRRPRASHIDGTTFDDPSEFEEWWRENGNGGEIIPLYLYDHSGITMSCGPFSCPWDSGQVGWIYATAEMIRKEFGCKRISKSVRERVDKCLRGEVETYDQFLTGQVYGYVIEDDEGNHLESCWGFFGLNYCIEEAKSAADSIAKDEGVYHAANI